MGTTDTTWRKRVRRGAYAGLFALALAACGGDADVQPVAVTATAVYVNTAVSASVAAVATVAAAGTANAVTMTAAALPPTPAPNPTAPPVASPPVSAVTTGATPTSLRAGVATNTRPATGSTTAAPTPGPRAATATTPGATAATAAGTAQRTAASGGATATISGGTVAFSDPGKRFTFSRPAAWRDASASATPADFVVSYLSTMPRGSFNIIASSVPTSATLAQYTNANIATIKRDVMGYRDGPVGLQSGDLGGTPAQLYDFFATVGGEAQLVTQIYCVRGGTLYVLSFITPVDAMGDEEQRGAFYDAAQVIVDTWKWL